MDSGGKAGLKRLIDSPLFDTWMALSYIWKYCGSEVGVEHALFQKLHKMPPKKVEFILPQLCQMLVCSSRESACLEQFVLEMCQSNQHAATFCLWYLEHFLADFRLSFARDSHLYLRAVRILGDLQRAIFGSYVTEPIEGSSNTLITLESAIYLDSKFPGVGPNIVASGMCLVGGLLPVHTLKTRSLILTEARKAIQAQKKVPKPIRQKSQIVIFPVLSDDPNIDPKFDPLAPGHSEPFPVIDNIAVDEKQKESTFSLQGYFLKAAEKIHVTPPTFMALSNSSSSTRSSTLSQNLAILSSRRPAPPPSVPLYYFAEMQFIMNLIDISMRLVHIPKENRLAALQTELSLVNHNLPASLCLPLWCKFGCNHRHSRILRICSNESVVLNSAERVPFLLSVEILDGDISDEEFNRIIAISTVNQDSKTSRSDSISNHRDDATDFEQFADCNSHSRSKTDTKHFNNDLCDRVDLDSPLTHASSNQSSSIYESSIENIQTLSSPHSILTHFANELTPITAEAFIERMKTAANVLAQLSRQAAQVGSSPKRLADIQAIKDRIIREMEDLEKNRLLDAIQTPSGSDEAGMDQVLATVESLNIIDDPKQLLKQQDDPSAIIFEESLDSKVERIRSASPYGHLDGWSLISMIVKSGTDMRQEQLACQIISEMITIWREAGLPLWAYAFRVLVASENGGLMEVVPNAISLHSIKKTAYLKHLKSLRSGKAGGTFSYTIRDHLIKTFGSPDSAPFIAARINFTTSLAAYSLATYILQIKDRHDGNILIDREGHLIHIDFGFMLSNSPGYVGFESAPFKLTAEYLEILGGLHSVEFNRFKEIIFEGFLELRKHADRILIIAEIMQKQSKLPCFHAGETALSQLKQRFHLNLTDIQLRQVVDRLVISSAYSVFTKLYDSYQYYSNGIL